MSPQGRLVDTDSSNDPRFVGRGPSLDPNRVAEVEVELHRGQTQRFLHSVDVQRAISQSDEGLESVRLPWIARVVDSYSGRHVRGNDLAGVGLESVAESAAEVRAESRFLTCELSPGVDARLVARELDRLPEVARAVAVPVAIPAEGADPMVGNGDLDPDELEREKQWYIQRCNVHLAWEVACGTDVVIVDIDSGYRITHQDLAEQIEQGKTYNAVDGTTDVTAGADLAHGTAVIGIAAAANNGVGLAGVAFGSSLWLVQAGAGGDPLTGSPWARGLDWARAEDSSGRRKVVVLEVQSASHHSYEQVPSVADAIQRAIAEGVVVCVAAGNGGLNAGVDDNGDPFPETGAIVVGATMHHAERNPRADWSNWGSRVTVAAPGDPEHDITCDSSTDDAYRNGFGGTSGATPKVAGVCALMLEVNPELTHAEIRSILRETGREVDTDPARPVGKFLDGAAAVQRARTLAHGALELFVRGPDGSLSRCRQRQPNINEFVAEPMDGWADRIVSARNFDGSLEIIARGAAGDLWSSRQSAPNRRWMPWRALGGSIESPSVQRDAEGTLEIFGRGDDGALWRCAQLEPGGAWGEWHSLARRLEAPFVVRRADGRLEVLGIGRDRDVCHGRKSVERSDAWVWSSLRGWVDRITAIVHVDGHLEVFARGSDRALWHTIECEPHGDWTPWKSLGGAVDRIVAARNADGRAEVFAIGLDHALWHVWQKTPRREWSAWHSLGGFVRELEVSAQADGRLAVFATDQSSIVHINEQRVMGAEWSGWMSLGIWADVLAVGRNALGA